MRFEVIGVAFSDPGLGFGVSGFKFRVSVSRCQISGFGSWEVTGKFVA